MMNSTLPSVAMICSQPGKEESGPWAVSAWPVETVASSGKSASIGMTAMS